MDENLSWEDKMIIQAGYMFYDGITDQEKKAQRKNALYKVIKSIEENFIQYDEDDNCGRCYIILTPHKKM